MSVERTGVNRRGFLSNSTAGLAAVGGGLLLRAPSVLARDGEDGPLTAGDVAILRFLATAELLETDLWQQYNELGGVNATASGYAAALGALDSDMSQYISDNTDDEVSHERFLNQYLAAKGAPTVDLEPFRTLPSSRASGAQQINRLTNLMQLTVDTSWWTRYRSAGNPDLRATFVQVIPSMAVGQHNALARDEAELGDPNNASDH